MFDITDKQIEHLDDTSLRELIARLCEAELSSAGLSPLLVTWGGNQNAKDGGVDVRVSLPEAAALPTNLPRHNCVFQVKAADMPAAEILLEMQPGGVLRNSIVELAALSGAYTIVSSQGSVSDTPLKSRREAMANAVAPLGSEHTLHLDFYDRTRIAGWVRQHAGVILWTRERVVAAIPGWQSYGDWAGAHESEDATYLSDGQARVLAPKQQEKLSVVEASNGSARGYRHPEELFVSSVSRVRARHVWRRRCLMNVSESSPFPRDSLSTRISPMIRRHNRLHWQQN